MIDRRTTDKYILLKSFCCVVENQSFAKAAVILGLPASSVSKQVSKLELQVKTPLLIRTTRSMSLTDAGQVYYRSGKLLLRQWDELDIEINNLHETPCGTLRITLPVTTGQYIMNPLISKFMTDFPKVKMDLMFTHKTIDLIEDDFDIAIRTWKHLPSIPLYKIDLIKLTPILVASPKYLEKHGGLDRVEDLNYHNLLIFQKENQGEHFWSFGYEKISIQGHLYSNDYLNLLDAAKNGIGIARVFSYIAQADINSGKLVEVLPHLQQSITNLSLIYKQPRNSSAKLNSFISFMEKAFLPNMEKE